MLNDEFRTNYPVTIVPGMVVFTSGVSRLALPLRELVLDRVRQFECFTEDNDPHAEHDFGSFELTNVGRIFWKIDYYEDGDMEYGAGHPEDVNASYRVLTVMLSSEY